MKRIISVLLILCLVCAASGALAEPEILVPEEYTKNGTLPIYTAIPQDLNANIQPELFNQSGIESRTDDRHNGHEVVFADEAILNWYADPESIFYSEYSGTFDVNVNEPEYAPELAPCPALSDSITSLASWAMDGLYGVYELEQTELARISLNEAQTALETLLAQLGITGYVCDYALDMSTERIQMLGEIQREKIACGEFFTNIPQPDWSLVTVADEGYYLSYHKPNETFAEGNRNVGQFEILAFVTERGVVNATIWDQYIPGEVCATPDSLLSPEDVIALLPGALAASRCPSTVVSVSRLRLIYSLRRASHKADGMVLTPAWYITYQDTEAEREGYPCFAIFDAVDGTLLGAIFQ